MKPLTGGTGGSASMDALYRTASRSDVRPPVGLSSWALAFYDHRFGGRRTWIGESFLHPVDVTHVATDPRCHSVDLSVHRGGPAGTRPPTSVA